MKKACPLKFNNHTMDDAGNIAEDECLCEETNCQFWTTANTSEGQPVSNCAITLIGMVGSIRV